MSIIHYLGIAAALIVLIIVLSVYFNVKKLHTWAYLIGGILVSALILIVTIRYSKSAPRIIPVTKALYTIPEATPSQEESKSEYNDVIHDDF